MIISSFGFIIKHKNHYFRKFTTMMTYIFLLYQLSSLSWRQKLTKSHLKSSLNEVVLWSERTLFCRCFPVAGAFAVLGLKWVKCVYYTENMSMLKDLLLFLVKLRVVQFHTFTAFELHTNAFSRFMWMTILLKSVWKPSLKSHVFRAVLSRAWLIQDFWNCCWCWY